MELQNFDKMGIVGHQKILEFLNRSLKTSRISHAYLFVGPEHLGKKTVTVEFTKALQCSNPQFPIPNSQFPICNHCPSCQEIEKNIHPDVLIIEPEIIETRGTRKEQEISIEKIRQIQHQLSLFAYRGPYKIVIIDQTEKMTKEAASALLKTLEEPTKKTIFILISQRLSGLAPTIISRCQLIKFLPVKSYEIEKFLKTQNISQKEAERITRLAFGKPGLAISYLNNPDLIEKQKQILEDLSNLLKHNLSFKFRYAQSLAKDLNLAQETLNQWLVFFRDLMLSQIGCQNLTIWGSIKGFNLLSLLQIKNIIQKIIKTDQILNNPSFNSRLALEVLMLEF